VRLSSPICRRGYSTEYRGLYGPVNLVRNGGQECGTGVSECVTTLWHTVIRLLSSGVPKAAVAQGDSRRRPSFLVIAAKGQLVAPQLLLLGERRAPLVRVRTEIGHSAIAGDPALSSRSRHGASAPVAGRPGNSSREPGNLSL
jgi:hypothetical protein